MAIAVKDMWSPIALNGPVPKCIFKVQQGRENLTLSDWRHGFLFFSAKRQTPILILQTRNVEMPGMEGQSSEGLGCTTRHYFERLCSKVLHTYHQQILAYASYRPVFTHHYPVYSYTRWKKDDRVGIVGKSLGSGRQSLVKNVLSALIS